MRPYWFVLIPMCMQLLNGCITIEAEDLEVEATGAAVYPGRCISRADVDAYECHVIDVAVRNVGDDTVHLWKSAWSLEGNGTEWHDVLVEHVDAVAPGEVGNLSVAASLPVGKVVEWVVYNGTDVQHRVPVPEARRG